MTTDHDEKPAPPAPPRGTLLLVWVVAYALLSALEFAIRRAKEHVESHIWPRR
jgi:hypothetical protein